MTEQLSTLDRQKEEYKAIVKSLDELVHECEEWSKKGKECGIGMLIGLVGATIGLVTGFVPLLIAGTLIGYYEGGRYWLYVQPRWRKALNTLIKESEKLTGIPARPGDFV